MKQLIAAFLLFIALAVSGNTYAQDFSNKGKEFWIAYSYHVGMASGAAPTMTLYITSDANTTYTVEAYGGATIATGSLSAGGTATVNIPSTYALNAEGPFTNKAIHVTAAQPIVVYSYITRSAASAATLCLPTTVLGKEYVASSFTQVSNENSSNCFISIIAVEDNTTVEITLTGNSVNGWLAGETHQVTLSKGQIYQVLGFTGGLTGQDLSGSRIKSVSTGTAACKRIAVFSGSGKIKIPNTNCQNTSDNLYQQLYPTGTWGKRYLSVPSETHLFNYFRVYSKDPGTNLLVNGSPVAFNSTGYAQIGPVGTPQLFEADQPISVAQYFTTQGCDGNSAPYDPDMIMLNPIEQNINNVTLINSNLAATGNRQHHIHVIMKNSGTGISTFRFDGNPVPASSWTVHPRDASYSYAYLADGIASVGVSQGYHKLTSDSGFLALAYGYADAESYGYSAGANVKDLYQFASIRNDYATVNFPSTCRNTPFRFSMTFPYQPTQIIWQFNGLFPDVTINNPTPDSSYLIGGKTVYRYMLPNTYSTNSTGTFPILIRATGATADGCGGDQEIAFDLQVLERPLAGFTFTSTGCVSDPVQFTDASNGQSRPFSTYNWTFGAGAGSSTLQNPLYTFPSAGAYQVKHWVTTDIGCISDTLPQTVNVSQPPVANFGAAAPYCVGKNVTFTDTSIVNGGTLTNWQWNFGDGSAVVNAATGAAQTHSYATAGTYTATLQVTSSGGCRSTVFPRSFTVGVNPVAGFTFGNACLPSGAMTFSNTSTITGGSALTYQWNFGPAGATSTATTPTYNYSSTGPFNASLVATTADGCTDTARQVINTVFARPTSTFSPSASPVAGKYCLNAPITFSSSATAPASSVSSYHWDFGDNTTGTGQTAPKTYPTAGTYIVKHWVESATGCLSDTTELTITIVALPTASFVVGAHRCAGDSISLLSNSSAVAPGSSITGYSWAANASALTGPQIAQMYLVPGSPTSQSIVLTVQTEVGCADDTTISVLVHPKPVPDFSLPDVCLPAGTATFANNTTISDGTISSVRYQWSFGDAGSSTQAAPTHTYTSTGPFDVRLTATSADGCVKDTVKQLTTVYAQPQAIFTASSPELCLGNAFTFNDGSTAPGSSVAQWDWDFGDGNHSSSPNPVHTYAAAGVYQVRLTVTSAVGCVSAPMPLSVTVNSLPTALFTIASPMCATRAITFTDASRANSGALQSWSWDFGDGSAAVTGRGPQVHAYSTVGTYGVKLTVTTDKGCTANVIDSAHVHPLPEPGFVIPQNCLADPYSQFNDTSRIAAPDVITAWSWNFGDNAANPPSSNVSNSQNPRHRFTVLGPYQVNLSVTSNNGCKADTTQQVVIAGTSPVPVLRVLQNSVCSNDSVRIKDSSWVDIGKVIRIDIWWDASDPSSLQTVLNPVPASIYSHKYPEFFSPASRSLNIKLVAYSGQTCANEMSQPLTLLATPDVRFAPVTGICENVPPFTLTQASTANNSVINGTPLFSGTGVSSSGLFSPASAGTGLHDITYTVTGANGCVNDTSMAIAVYSVPTVSAGADKFILEGGVDTLDGTGTGNSIIYVWTPARWLSDDSSARPLVRPQGDQLYTLTVTSADGCTNEDAVLVTMLKAPLIPNVFTPNGDAVNDRWVIQYLESYPGATVDIFNRYGQPVFSSVNYTTPWDGTLNGKPLPTGTYYYIINPKNGRKQMSGFVDLIR